MRRSLPPPAGRRFAAASRIAVVLVLTTSWLPTGLDVPDASATARVADPAWGDLARPGWVWPADRFRLHRAYAAPAHEYGPGHRGLDLDLLDGTHVRAPSGGVIAFSGSVAGRGILTIDHGDGLVTTLEPVESALVPGHRVQSGAPVATLSFGGHTPAGVLHFGVRRDGAYINPLLLLGGVPRAVLLPCCR